MTPQLAFPHRLVPRDARLLAEVSRSLGGIGWTTWVWVRPDGRHGAAILRSEGAEVVACVRRDDAASLAELDRALSRELARRGPQGDARIAVLSSAAVALEEAQRRAA